MVKKSDEVLTRRERQIMDILHRRGHATAHEVLEDLADPPSYSAIRALLRLLCERNHVRYVEKDGRYIYSPVKAPSEARKAALAHVVHTFFASSVEQTMVALLDSRQKLSREELDNLAKLIDKARKEGR
jgi:BlaI family transcriptional regulator, penicillinase repressor